LYQDAVIIFILLSRKLARNQKQVASAMPGDIQERPASRTAAGVAVLRALHELYDQPPKF
jgi:hypothetical protein